jgi:hypothetical protein
VKRTAGWLRVGGYLLLALVWLAGTGLSVAADPPVLERLVPAGGQRGTTVTAKLVGKPGEGNIRLQSDSSGLLFRLGEKRDSVEIEIAAEAAAGVHLLRLCNDAGASELRPFIVGILPEQQESEPNGRLSEAATVASSAATVNGVLEKAGDVDSWAVSLEAGQTLVASLTASRILGSPMDGVLQIVDGRGTVVAQNDDDCSMDPLVTYTAAAAGTWYVRVFAFPAAPNSTIGFAGGADYVYRLTVGAQPFVHHAMPLVRQQGGGELRLQLHGWNLAVQEAVLGAGQNVLTGQFAQPWRVYETAEPVVLEQQLPERVLKSLPVAICGCLEQPGADVFLLELKKGQRLSLTAEVRRFASLLDPVLSVRDATGRVLKEADDVDGGNPDASLDITAPADGRFEVRIQDRFLGHGDRWHYVLRCRETVSECRLTVQGTAWTLPADKSLEIPVAVERRNGFADVLTLQVAGLPEGVTAEPVSSAKEGDTAKAVTLKIAGKLPAVWSGEIRLTGRTEDGREFPVVWSAADGTDVVAFWLTVPAAGG